MITQDEILDMSIEQFAKKVEEGSQPNDNGIVSGKQHFLIGRLEGIMSDVEDFSRPFIPDFYTLYFVQDGRFEKTTQLKKVELESYDMYFSKPGEVKKWKSAENLKGYFVAFTKEYLLTLLDNKNFLSSFEYLVANVQRKFQLNKSQYLFFNNAFGEIDYEYSYPKKHSQTSIKLWLSVLIIKIDRMYKAINEISEETSLNSSSDLIYQKFMVLLEDNFTKLGRRQCIKPYSVYELAQKLNINPSYLNECVKKSSRKTAKTLINERWLLMAKCELMHTNKNISEIAYNLGFESPGYFARFLRKFEGMSPVDFRKSLGP